MYRRMNVGKILQDHGHGRIPIGNFTPVSTVLRNFSYRDRIWLVVEDSIVDQSRAFDWV